MKLIKIIIALVILSIAANAEVTFKINNKMQTINIVDIENNINIVTSIRNVTTRQFVTRFNRSFYIYISPTSETIYVNENIFNELKTALMKE